MPNQVIYFRNDLYNKLREEVNMSSLINFLLDSHYNDPLLKMEASKREAVILEETKTKMKDVGKYDKLREWINTHFDKKAYMKGVKEKKWRSVVEYANIMIKEKGGKK